VVYLFINVNEQIINQFGVNLIIQTLCYVLITAGLAVSKEIFNGH